jgi:type II secretory pathway component PulK
VTSHFPFPISDLRDDALESSSRAHRLQSDIGNRKSEIQKGFVLITLMVVLFALAALAITLAYVARTELQASQNQASQYAAEAAQRGAEQYVLALLTDQRSVITTLDNTYFEAVPVGVDDGTGSSRRAYFWIVRPDYSDADLPPFGLVDESAKVNLNVSLTNPVWPYTMLTRIPNLTPEVAASIINWRDADDDASVNGTTGAESNTYLARSDAPHRAKNANFESVDELQMIEGVTPELYFGTGSSSSTIGGEAVERAGWQHYFTVWSSIPGANNTVSVGRINVNQAPRDVLRALPFLTDADVDKLLSARPGAIESNPTSTAWVNAALGRTLSAAERAWITGAGRQFSADIVAVSPDGRAFKRVRIVVDTISSPVRIVFRRDLSDQGFPLDPQILASLRAGRGLPASTGVGF